MVVANQRDTLAKWVCCELPQVVLACTQCMPMLIHQGPNQSIKDACLQYWRSSLGLQICKYLHKTDVTSMYIFHLKLSINLILGLPLGLLPSITLTYTFLVVLSLFMSSNLHFQFSCLLLITSKMSSCPSCCLISSLLILCNLLTPWILLITLIWVAALKCLLGSYIKPPTCGSLVFFIKIGFTTYI